MIPRLPVFAAVVVTVLAVPVSTLAQEGGPARAPLAVSAGASIAFTSAYVWRGFVPADEGSLQPSAWASFGNLTISSWFNVSASGGSRPINEHDLTVDYTRAAGSWRLSAGYINYFFSATDTDRFSDEFYAGIAGDIPLNPFLKVFADVHRGKGTYVSGGISEAVSAGAWTFTPSATLGYNHHQWVEGSGLSDLNLGLQMGMPTIAGRVSVAPFVNLSKSFRTAWFPSKAYAGVTVTVR